jgi:inner membrane transporter RhtA
VTSTSRDPAGRLTGPSAAGGPGAERTVGDPQGAPADGSGEAGPAGPEPGSTRWARTRRTATAPAVLFVISGGSMYAGAAIAVLLFGRMSPAAVSWLRLLGAALLLVAWRRPWRGRPWRGRAGLRRLALAGGFGLATALMNLAFYEAIDRLPLGTAVAIEFCGPVAVAAVGSRTRRDLLAVLLAAGGVGLVADVRWASSPAGLGFAVAAAVLWAAYIVLGSRVAGRGSGIDDLAIGMLLAVLVLAPLALGTGPVWHSPRLLIMGLGVGLASSVLPYVLDQVVLRGLGRRRFALMLAVLPVTAALLGLALLHQLLHGLEIAGVLLVVAAVALTART